MKKEEILNYLLNPEIKLSTVSGVLTTMPNLIKWVDENVPDIDIITTKSYKVDYTFGNREPILFEKRIGCFGNNVGLRNPGMLQGYKDLLDLRKKHDLKSLLNVSLAANSIFDFIKLVERFEKVADIIELNFSCPHAEHGLGSTIGSDAELVYYFIYEIRKRTGALLFPKLTPNVKNIGKIAMAAINAGADGIVAINTVGPKEYKTKYSPLPILWGGASGKWIKRIALNSVKEIRAVVGRDVPIIGIGGVENRRDVLNMMKAGANVIGIGSSFMRIPTQKEIPIYVYYLKTGENKVKVSNKRLMKYKQYRVIQTKLISDTLKIIKLNGNLNYKSSQFGFLCIPEYGEKPFSIAQGNPITFLVRKRGTFTRALFNLEVGSKVLFRGPYGKSSPIPLEIKKAIIVCGGTGLAVVPKLSWELKNAGKSVEMYCGFRQNEIILDTYLKRYCDNEHLVEDNGVEGKVLEILENDMKQSIRGCEGFCFYNIGPEDFMRRAANIEQNLEASYIFNCVEKNTMCGVGACGTCEHNGWLTCKEGTFVKHE